MNNKTSDYVVPMDLLVELREYHGEDGRQAAAEIERLRAYAELQRGVIENAIIALGEVYEGDTAGWVQSIVGRVIDQLHAVQRQGADSPTSATIDPSADQDHAPARNNAQSTVGALQEATETPSVQSAPATSELYHELLFAVGNKYEGESRHQTALRYIQQAELRHQSGKKWPPLPEGDVPDHQNIADMLPSMLLEANARCPLCGQQGPHPHSAAEIVIYRNGVKYGRMLVGECHQVGREVLDMTVPISTDVRMPDDGQECVFLSKGGYWHAGRYLGAARFDRPANTFVGVGLSQCASTVTHWLPVPDLRTVAGKKCEARIMPCTDEDRATCSDERCAEGCQHERHAIGKKS
jgi:hypothetical protein